MVKLAGLELMDEREGSSEITSNTTNMQPLPSNLTRIQVKYIALFKTNRATECVTATKKPLNEYLNERQATFFQNKNKLRQGSFNRRP